MPPVRPAIPVISVIQTIHPAIVMAGVLFVAYLSTCLLDNKNMGVVLFENTMQKLLWRQQMNNRNDITNEIIETKIKT